MEVRSCAAGSAAVLFPADRSLQEETLLRLHFAGVAHRTLCTRSALQHGWQAAPVHSKAVRQGCAEHQRCRGVQEGSDSTAGPGNRP